MGIRSEHKLENNLDKKIEQTQEFFPKIGIIYLLYGPETYNRVIEAYTTPSNAKFLAEYIDSIILNLDKRTYDIFMMYIGFYCPKNQSKMKFNSNNIPFPPNGMHPQMIANSYGLSQTRIIQILQKYTYHIKKQLQQDIINDYINGKIDTMLSKMPRNLQNTFKFQRKYKIADMPTYNINIVAEWMRENFPIKREIPTSNTAITPPLDPLEHYLQKHK